MSTHSPGNGSDAEFVKTLFESFPKTSPQNVDLGFSTASPDPTVANDYCAYVNLSSKVYIYLIPAVILVGIVGNAMSVYVFTTSKLRFLSTSQYLSALAISDSIFLLSLIPPWLSTLKINKLFHRNGFCQIFVYISYVTSCLSAWLVIAFTVERFVAVQYPLQRNAFCTVKRARYVIATLTVGALLVNCPVLGFAGPGVGEGECNIGRDHLVHAARFNLVDMTISFTIPTALILILNLWIVYVVCKLEQARMKMLQLVAAQAGEVAGSLRSQQRVTRMLLLVSSVFVLFNLPAYTLRFLAYWYDLNSKAQDNRLMAVQHVATMLFDANFGINFFLYCLSGQNFRRALLQALPCFAWLVRGTTAMRTVTFNRGRAASVTTSAFSNGTEPTHCGLSSVAQRPAPRLVVRWGTPRPRADATEDIEMTDIRPRARPYNRSAHQPPLRPPGDPDM